MATREELLTIQSIQDAVKELNKRNLKIEVLGGDFEAYRKAIISVRNSGVLSVALTVIGFVINIIAFITSNLAFGYIIAGILMGVAAIAIAGAIALRIYTFKATPKAILFMLIAIVIVESFALPFFFIPVVILPIIPALVRWSTYKSWFNDIKKEAKKEIEKHRNKD